jgi:outer membrane protein assembly factor BamA
MKINYFFFSIFLISLICINSAISQNENGTYKFEIKEINFIYKSEPAFDKSVLKSIIKTGKSDYLDFTELAEDVLKIEKFYFDNGYFDASVDTTIIINHKSKTASVTFTINENSAYTLNKIEYIGLEHIEPSLRTTIFSGFNEIIKKDLIYSRNNISQEIFRIINILNNNGYADAFFDPPEIIKLQSNFTKFQNKVNIKLIFKTGSVYKFGITKVVFKNYNYNLSEYDLLRELEYNEGDIYSKEKVIETENKISKIAIIENGRLISESIDSLYKRINFNLQVSVRNKYELQPEIFGYDISNRFYGGIGISFSDRYFLGGGRTETSKLRVLAHSEDLWGIEMNLKLYQPYIFNNYKITGNWDLTGSFFSDVTFNISEIKNQFLVNYELPRHTYINNLILSWNLSNQRFSTEQTVPFYFQNKTILLPGFSTNIFSSVLGITPVHNSTNDYLFPTMGYFQLWSVEESGLFGSLFEKILGFSSVKYFKMSNLNKFFINLSGSGEISKIVLANKFLIGAIFEYGENKLETNNSNDSLDISIIPLESKFVAGGSTSVRGWAAKKLGTFPEKENGGNFILEGSFELRFRPFIEQKNIFKDVGFVTFLDYGNLWQTPGKFKFNDIAIAIGCGLRYFTIIGPIRLDFGFKLYDYDPAPDTKTWLFQNTFSQIFKEKFQFQFGIGQTF